MSVDVLIHYLVHLQLRERKKIRERNIELEIRARRCFLFDGGRLFVYVLLQPAALSFSRVASNVEKKCFSVFFSLPSTFLLHTHTQNK